MSATEDDDARLAALVADLADKEPSPENWEKLYIELFPFVYATAFRYLHADAEAARDVAQDVFLRVLKYGLNSSVDSVAGLRAYLRIVTRNLVLDTLSRQKREKREEMSSPLLVPSISEDTDDWLAIDLEARVDGLSDVERRLLELLIQGYGVREISIALGMPYSAAGVRIHRLRNKLYKALGFKDLGEKPP